MVRKIKPASALRALKYCGVVGVALWATTATVLLLRLQPQVVLIGIDQYGTRIIRNEDDRLLKVEQDNFLKRYLAYSFVYDAANFDERISSAGDMMSADLWGRKRDEFAKLSKNLKGTPITQAMKIREMREVAPNTYEADLEIVVKSKLQEAVTRIRVELKLRKTSRTPSNPYQYEVENHVENSLS